MTDTLKSICEQCPRLNAPQLDFIPQEAARQEVIIRRDLRELVVVASEELPRSVVLLAGSLFESVLFSFLSGQTAFISSIRRAEFVFDPSMTLQNFKEIFNRYFRRAIPGSELPDLIVEYRNTIHINREMAWPEDVCTRASADLLRILDKLLADLTNFVSAAPG